MDLFASSEDEKKLLNKTLLLINQSEGISDKKAAEAAKAAAPKAEAKPAEAKVEEKPADAPIAPASK